MKHPLRAISFAACFVCLMLVGAHVRPADGQDFSGKPIRILVGVAAGGATDVTARLIAQKLSASLHTNVYVENKTGGAFEPVFRELTNAAPDGGTLFMISAAMVVNQPAQVVFIAQNTQQVEVSFFGATEKELLGIPFTQMLSGEQAIRTISKEDASLGRIARGRPPPGETSKIARRFSGPVNRAKTR